MNLLLLFIISTVLAQECDRGYYGLNCGNYCEGCKYEKCDPVDGSCQQCKDGYELKDGSVEKTCTPICFGDEGCSNNGVCVAPNHCVCGRAGAQISSMNVIKNGYEGYDCVSLRMSGIKGAVAAMFAIIVCIFTCGMVAPKSRNVNKHRAYKWPFWVLLPTIVTFFILGMIMLYREAQHKLGTDLLDIVLCRKIICDLCVFFNHAKKLFLTYAKK